MKVPVYLEPSLELIGVVDIDPSQQYALEQQRFLQVVKWPGMPMSPHDPLGPIADLSYQTETVMFRYFPLKNASGARTICLTVAKREWLSAWEKQLWPRKRKKGFRLTKAQRRARRGGKMMDSLIFGGLRNAS